MSNSNQQKQEKITTSEAAQLLGVSRATLARAAKRGEVPPGVCTRLLGRYSWSLKACEEWVVDADVSCAPPPPKKRGRPNVLASVVV